MPLDIGIVIETGEREVEVPNWQDEPAIPTKAPEHIPEREKEDA